MGITLEALAEKYQFVVFDTSILGTALSSNTRKVHYATLLTTLKKYDNIVTSYVLSEHSKKTKGLKIIRKRNLTYYQEILDYISPLVRQEELNEKTGQPLSQADVRLATLALSIAYQSKSAAFVSLNRKLNAFLSKVLILIPTEEHPLFPKKINQFDIYSFVQREVFFIPYTEIPYD